MAEFSHTVYILFMLALSHCHFLRLPGPGVSWLQSEWGVYHQARGYGDKGVVRYGHGRRRMECELTQLHVIRIFW